MSYTHLTTFERGRLEALDQFGWSRRKIAKELGRHHSTISRELGRNRVGGSYSAEKAQDGYKLRRKSSTPNGKFTPSLKQTIEEKLALTWSPEQIVG